MSKSILYDLYFGNLAPWERACPQDPAYKSINRKISDLKVHFRETLSADEYRRLEELDDLKERSGAFDDVDLFEYGLCMGVLLMIEVFHFKENRLTERENE